MDKKTKEIVDFASNGIIENGWLKMPVLYTMDKGGKFRYWQVIVGIAMTQPSAERSDTNGLWLKSIKFHPVTQDLIERGEMPDGAQGVYWSRSGQEGGVEKTTKPSYVVKGTNVGKKNYTTSFTQAIRKAMTGFNLKIKKGAVPDKTNLRARDAVYTMDELFDSKHLGKTPWRVFVMALHDVNKAKNWDRIKYPAFLQQKYDGTRFVVVSHPRLPSKDLVVDGTTKKFHIDSYSRGRESYDGQDHILAELAPVMAKYPGLHLDGELYKKGHALQDISGSSRREKSSKTKRAEALVLDYYVFDAFYIDKPKMPFEERNAILDDFFDDLEASRKTSYVVRAATVEVETKQELVKLYESYIEKDPETGKQKFEGGVIRNKDSPYEMGVNKEERTRHSFKIKPRFDAEFPIYSFVEGKGKAKGALVWECATSDDSKPLEDRKKFTTDLNWPYEKRYDAFEYFTKNPDVFEKEFKGQDAVLEYATMSKDKIPQQPKFIRFRDLKLDERLNELLG